MIDYLGDLFNIFLAFNKGVVLNKDIYRITLDLNPWQGEILRRLESRLDFDKHISVFRASLVVLDVLLGEIEKGGTCMIKKSDGSEVQVILPFLVSRNKPPNK